MVILANRVREHGFVFLEMIVRCVWSDGFLNTYRRCYESSWVAEGKEGSSLEVRYEMGVTVSWYCAQISYRKACPIV